VTLLYLVRHGETDWNLARRIQGSTDIPLNDTGREQATATGRLLARRKWDGIISSPLRRATETAEIIAGHVGVRVSPTVDALAERHYGAAEGLTGEEVEARFPHGAGVPGRETRDEVVGRVLPMLFSIAEEHAGGSLIVVSHGGVIRAVLNSLVDEERPQGKHTEPLGNGSIRNGSIRNGSIRNGSIHSFRHTDGTLELIAFDDPIDAESLACASDELEQQNAIEFFESVKQT
jgi:uncharacterized phosphatase